MKVILLHLINSTVSGGKIQLSKLVTFFFLFIIVINFIFDDVYGVGKGQGSRKSE